MKKLIKAQQDIFAMAIINPDMCQNLAVRVSVKQAGEGPIPHVHVRWKNGKECCIRLDKAKYSERHKNQPQMPKDVKDSFICIMESERQSRYNSVNVNGIARFATGYEMAVDIWCNTYEHGSYAKFSMDENDMPIMPDYSSL